ncbi:ribonuclease H-like domain-containing protein [Tanacetum coccineum]|uniref:Ribonuclease H-like domain-containing protein n=1 Tax=Tanacetum coccineum TaxID=301880 RepID=A0ABQ5FDN6_9ASTR
MVTRFRVGTNRPTKRLNLHVSSVSSLPKSYHDAFRDPNWQNAMHGTFSRYKARLVANGSTELEGVDVDETFSPVVKPGISVTRDSLGLFLSQKKYDVEILDKYLTFTRPDISYAVQQVCLYMHDPREPHSSALKRILCYVRGTLDYGLQLFSSSTTDLVAYSDADWAGCPTTRRSTSGYCVFLGNNLLSWSSQRQPTISRSSAVDEYRGVANAVAETCWLRNLLRELHTQLSFATLVYCDNVSVVYLSCNPVQHQRTKHIEIDIHFVCDLVAAGQVRVLHVPSRYQFADIFTKEKTRRRVQVEKTTTRQISLLGGDPGNPPSAKTLTFRGNHEFKTNYESQHKSTTSFSEWREHKELTEKILEVSMFQIHSYLLRNIKNKTIDKIKNGGNVAQRSPSGLPPPSPVRKSPSLSHRTRLMLFQDEQARKSIF